MPWTKTGKALTSPARIFWTKFKIILKITKIQWTIGWAKKRFRGLKKNTGGMLLKIRILIKESATRLIKIKLKWFKINPKGILNRKRVLLFTSKIELFLCSKKGWVVLGHRNLKSFKAETSVDHPYLQILPSLRIWIQIMWYRHSILQIYQHWIEKGSQLEVATRIIRK